MTRHYIFALTMIAVLVIGSCIMMQTAFEFQEVKIRVNALATEQSRLFKDIGSMTRGLMQSAAGDEVPEASLDNLRERIKQKTARVRANTAEILTIDTDRLFGLFNGGAVARLYRQDPFPLEKKLNTFLSRADEIASMDTARLHNRLKQWSPIDVVVSSATLMQNDFDDAMLNSFKTTEQNIARIRIVEIVMTSLAIALIVMEAVTIFAPLVRRMRSDHETTILQQEMLQAQSRLDGLTGLGNRLAFQEQLLSAVARSRTTQAPLGLILFDLDRFKPINDSFGHPAGDALLEAVGRRTKAAAGPDAFVARLGGDEFGILSSEAADDETIRNLVMRVKQAVEQSVDYQGHEIMPLVSFGGALLNPAAPESGDWLLGAADTALYKAKHQRLGFALLDERLKIEAAEEKQLALDLREALTHAQLEVFYQAQVRLADNLIVGFEALVHWRHPDRGLLGPELFLPLSERYGFTTDLTALVVNRVSDDLRRWIDRGHAPGIVAINIPEAMLATGLARRTIDDAMARNALDRSRVSVEVTEDVLLDRNAAQIAENLRAMRAGGLRVCFDDFGTGYASLSHLRQFPLDEIKIARSFVRDLMAPDGTGEIVSSLIGLAGRLRKTVVADGVETRDQLRFLVQHGCHVGQGRLFSQPVPFDDALELIKLKRIPPDQGSRDSSDKVRSSPLATAV